jgi:hypothetical protein
MSKLLRYSEISKKIQDARKEAAPVTARRSEAEGVEFYFWREKCEMFFEFFQ